MNVLVGNWGGILVDNVTQNFKSFYHKNKIPQRIETYIGIVSLEPEFVTAITFELQT